MGCDGGTIPKRDELVKVKKKPEVKDKQSELAFLWRYCCISQDMLQIPIVTCGLGRLYNKSSVIEGLLNRTLLPASAKHIRSLKDIKDLNLSPNPEFDSGAEKPEGMLDDRAAPYICPVTGLEMSGKFRFICLWSCGCVMSERAIKEIETHICHKCQQPFTSRDIIVLNGNEDDVKIMQENMKERQALQKAQKKSKKVSLVEKSKPTEIQEIPEPKSSTSIATPSCSGFKSNNLKRSNNVEKNALVDPEIKKIKTDYSVAKDPKVTDVYKSLFTTHHSEQQQTRAHWVTYNPFYN